MVADPRFQRLSTECIKKETVPGFMEVDTQLM